MVVNMDETKLCSVARLTEFLAGALEVSCSGMDGMDGTDAQRSSLTKTRGVCDPIDVRKAPKAPQATRSNLWQRI